MFFFIGNKIISEILKKAVNSNRNKFKNTVVEVHIYFFYIFKIIVVREITK